MDVRKLNGSGWGEILDDGPQIPVFMLPEYQKLERDISAAEDAFIAAAKRRKHRRASKKLRRRVDGNTVLIIVLTLITLCAVVTRFAQ